MSAAEFNNFLVISSEFLMPFAFALTEDKEDAKDLYQETVYRALAYKDKYNGGTNLKAWLYTIMRNVFINDYRKKSRQQAGGPKVSGIAAAGGGVAGNAMNTIAKKDIERKVFDLPDILKQPFVLYFTGFRYTEIAHMLNEPLGTVKSRIFFARKLLKLQVERF